MRHALFVAFHFPPEASSSGVLRTAKYVRYLPERGYRISVVTADASAYDVTDASLEAQLKADRGDGEAAYRLWKAASDTADSATASRQDRIPSWQSSSQPG